MKQIKITVASCSFRGRTLFRGDDVPEKGERELDANEMSVMVPRLAVVKGEETEEPKPAAESQPDEEPPKEEPKPAAKKAAKKAAKDKS